MKSYYKKSLFELSGVARRVANAGGPLRCIRALDPDDLIAYLIQRRYRSWIR